jgi:hypothetical protein
MIAKRKCYYGASRNLVILREMRRIVGDSKLSWLFLGRKVVTKSSYWKRLRRMSSSDRTPDTSLRLAS